MSMIDEAIEQLQTRFNEKLERHIHQAIKHEHQFICYDDPQVETNNGQAKMIFQLKTLKDQVALDRFLISQKKSFHVIDVSQLALEKGDIKDGNFNRAN